MPNLASHNRYLTMREEFKGKNLKGRNSQYFLFVLMLSLIAFFSLISAPFALSSENKVVKLNVGNVKIYAEVAANSADRERGLSGRDLNSAKYFMLFVFDQPRQAIFWMKDTRQNLAVAFISESGRILEIRSLTAESLETVRSKSKMVKFALEVPRGYFENKRIKVNDRLEIPTSVLNMSQQS